MPVQVFKNEFPVLPAATMAAWADIPPAIAGDCMNRQNVVAGRSAPAAPGLAGEIGIAPAKPTTGEKARAEAAPYFPVWDSKNITEGGPPAPDEGALGQDRGDQP